MATGAPARRLANETAGLTERQRETAAEVRRYVEEGLAPVGCESCGVQAMVRKNSRKHTSVQWTPRAVAACPEISAARRADPDALVLGCPRMKHSIEQAVRAGQVMVPDG